MTKIIIYHNPKCSKSRETLKLLKENGINPEIIEYLNHPPSESQIKKILSLLKIKPRELMRTNEKIYKELNLSDRTLTDAELIAAMHKHPILIQRPIVTNNNKAAIGRPPENVLSLIS